MVFKSDATQDKGVQTQHPEYTKRVAQWERCRDVVAGSDAVHKKAEQYLPKLKDQTVHDYTAYVLRTPFYNASSRTVSGLKGMVFRKPPIKDVPTSIEPLLKDIDLSGTPFDIMAQEVTNEVLATGRVGVLVDYPTAPENIDGVLTVAVAEKVGLRPIIKTYCTENIINWKFKQINNKYTLCQVVLSEQFTQPTKDIVGNEKEFGNETETRWRVLDLENDTVYRMRVFRIDEAGHDTVVSTTYPLLGGKALNFIPFLVITEDGVSFKVEEPPMLDLFDVNLSHYRTSADYEHGCHFTALPTLFIAGYEPVIPTGGASAEKIYLGSTAAITMPDPSAKAEFIEFTGQGLTAVENNLSRKEQQMAILGARMLATEGKNQQSTTTTAIHRTGENSVLSAISIAVSLGLSQGLTWFAAWAGTAQDCTYELNKDFLPVVVDGPTLVAVMGTWQAGAMSDEEFFDWMQRGDLIEAETTFEDHQAQSFQDPVAKALAMNPKPDPATGPIKANPEKK